MTEVSSNNSLFEDSFFSEMICSQSNLEEKLSILKDAVKSDRPIEEKLQELRDFLSIDNIQNASVDILDEKIFNVALLFAKEIYLEVMQNINEIIKSKQKNSAENLKDQLCIIIKILSCWDLCIDYIRTLKKISVIDIKSFPESLLDIITDALSYCKTSASHYEENFKSVSEVVTSLFRQCVNTLNSFYGLLDCVILFNVNEENGMDILLKIIDATGKLATLSGGMDAKTLTDLWKYFGKFSTNYNLQMKAISPSTITSHFKGLSQSIITILLSIDQKNQRSSNERCILCCRLLIKILEKLCENYCGWIRNDVMIEIISMLPHLYRYTEPCLKISGYNQEFIKFISSNFSCIIEPFIDIIFKNDSFKASFFDYGNIVSENVSYHLLLLTIIKKISMLPYETQKEWVSCKYSIFDAAFQNIDRLSKNICMSNLRIDVSRDLSQGSYMTNIYEATYISICSLVCQITNSEFSDLITLLLRFLLNGNFYSSLLSSDIWCFVCRLGSSDMCYNTYKYLMQVYEMLGERKNNYNVVMLANLLSRQFKLLLDKDKADFICSIENDTDPLRYSCIASVMDPQKKKQFQQQLEAFTVNSRISEDLNHLTKQPSLNSLRLLEKDLSIIEVSDVPQDEESINEFTKIWNKMIYILSDSEGILQLLLEDFITSLLRATRLQEGQSKYTTMILESITSLYPYASSALRLEFCDLFNRCAVHFTDDNSSVLGELFCRLLGDEDPCVQQQAFESFEHLTRACPDADLLSSIALAIKNTESEISKTLPAYISGEIVHRLEGFANFDDFFTALCNAMEMSKHVCPKITQMTSEEKLLKLDDDASQLEDLEKQANKMCTDMKLLINFKGDLSPETYNQLRQLCQRFLEQNN